MVFQIERLDIGRQLMISDPYIIITRNINNINKHQILGKTNVNSSYHTNNKNHKIDTYFIKVLSMLTFYTCNASDTHFLKEGGDIGL